jgi:hypothetical protein
MIFVYEKTVLGVGQTPHILWALTGASQGSLNDRAGETLLYPLFISDQAVQRELILLGVEDITGREQPKAPE